MWPGRPLIWVPAFTPGTWFQHEVRMGLWGLELPYVVTQNGMLPKAGEYSIPPRFRRTPRVPSPPFEGEQPDMVSLDLQVQMALCTMARLRTVVTAEVAAQLQRTEEAIRPILYALAEAGYVERTSRNTYAAWSITRSGVMAAYRGWGLPPRTSDRWKGGRERSRGKKRHRRVSRIWPAWLQKTLDGDVWAGWSEPRNLAEVRGQPDALAWGAFEGYETLFWLEVESGRGSDQEVREITMRRYERMARWTRYNNYRAVFIVLGVPRVIRAVLPAMTSVYQHTAIVMEDWKNVGTLPRPSFGTARANREHLQIS